MACIGRRVVGFSAGGFSLIEMIIVLALLSALGALAIPLLEIVEVRAREKALRAALTDMRQAIDRYQRNDHDLLRSTGRDPYGPASFPASLGSLIASGLIATLPANPMLAEGPRVAWEVRGSTTAPESWEVWPSPTGAPLTGTDVFDVRCPATGLALDRAVDGSLYRDW